MHEILVKTYELIDILDNSDIIKNIEIYKSNILNNKEIIDLINKGNNTDQDYELIDIKKKLYEYKDYKNYMDCYNKLMYIVMNINNRYKKLLNERSCIK